MKSHDSCLLISLPLAECNVGTSALIQRSSSSDKISLENDKSYDLLKKPSKTDNSGNSYDLNSSKNMNFESFFVNENEKSLLNCSFSLVDAKNQVTELMKSTNADYLTETLKRMDAVNALKNISLQLQTIKMKEDVHLKRESIKMNIAFFNYCEEYSEAELARIHNNIFMYGSFINFLLTTTLKDCLVNIQAFLTKYIKLNKNFYKHSKRCIVMKSKFDMPLKSMTKKGSIKRKQEIFDLLSESRKSGRIIQRLKLQADLLSYYDIDIVADALLKQNKWKYINKNDIISIIFDELYALRDNYPLISDLTYRKLPNCESLLLKALNPPFIDEKWKNMTIGELSHHDWPLKIVIDSLVHFMFLINPFKIARLFSLVITKIGDIFINKEIDFDQLFGLLVVSIICCGISDILSPLKYACEFSEFSNDSTIDYAMSHMEGLCEYFAKLDFIAIKKKSKKFEIEFLEEYESGDPLGIL